MSEDAKKKAAERAALMAAIAQGAPPPEERQHTFWNTQPVPQSDDAPAENGPIEVKTVADVRPDPYPLPAAYEWSDCRVDDEAELEEVYQLLFQHYVEDDDNMFRFDYSREFLRWALLPPGYLPQLHVGVRAAKSRKLVAFITGVPANISVHGQAVPMVEINFLCIHKKLRSKRLAPVLIKEITRRVNLTGVWQAVYTAGVKLPTPMAMNRYYHRSLNPKKLIDVGFSRLPRNMSMARTILRFRVAAEPKTPGVRAMEPRDCEAAHALLVDYFRRRDFKLHQNFSLDEFAHMLLPRKGVVSSYVVEDPESGKITDFFSFYSLPSSIIGNPDHQTLFAAYNYYTVAAKTPLKDLMGDALILAKSEGFDVFNALDLMDNSTFLEELRFGRGDGELHYYVYNWRPSPCKPEEVALVLL